MLKQFYYKFISRLNIVRKDQFPISFFKKINLWRKGFLAEKFTLYQLDKNNYKDYLSDYHAAMARWINEPFIELLTNKLIFSEYVGKYIKVPETYGIIVNGHFYSNDKRSIENLIDQFEIFVIKSISGGGGKGVYIIKREGNDEFLVNNTKTYSFKELVAFVTTLNNYIFTNFIEPSAFSKSLNATSVNTMRIITLIDPITNEAFIARAVQRIGVVESAPQDNFTKGGLSASINLETGELSDCTRHPKSKEHKKYTHHPETNVKIEGTIIPDWSSIKTEILDAANSLPMLKCVGWDFVLSTKGLVAIEGNHHPDPDVLQGHEPLLTDKRIKAFYKFHKII